jgi:hypothetical protein
MKDDNSLSDFQQHLAQEVSSLSDDVAPIYGRYAVKPFRAWRHLGTTVVPSFVVAQAGDDVVYYDDIEEEFGTASLDSATSQLRNEGTWGERLEWALRHFPESSN